MSEENTEVKRRRNYEAEHPFFCNWFYSFYFPYVCRIDTLTLDDTPELVPADRTHEATDRLLRTWPQKYVDYAQKRNAYEKSHAQDEKPPSSPSLLVETFRAFFDPICYIALFILIASLSFTLTEPYLSEKFYNAAYDKESDDSVKIPVAPAIMLILAPFLNAVFNSFGYRILVHFACKLRGSLTMLAYRKMLRLSYDSLAGIDPGYFTTLISYDIKLATSFLPLVLSYVHVPFQFIISFILLLHFVGAGAWLSIAVFVVVVPILVLLLVADRWCNRNFLRTSHILNMHSAEPLEGIRTVKFLSLEDFFHSKLGEFRKDQTLAMGLLCIVYEVISNFLVAVTTFSSFVLIVIVVFKDDGGVDAYSEKYYPYTGYLSLMQGAATNVNLFCDACITFSVYFIHLRNFLILPERDEFENSTEELSDTPFAAASKPAEDDVLYEASHANFIWGEHIETERTEASKKHEGESSSSSSSSSPSRDKTTSKPPETDNFLLNDISLKLRKGTLTIVYGAMGSGKTSLGTAIIGELKKTTGEVKTNISSVCYCPQKPWIIGGSIRHNIMLSDHSTHPRRQDSTSSQSAEERMKRAVHVCGLDTDLDALVHGVDTVLSEHGGNLSGGQKARVQLARAVYSNADLCVLDEPIIALDALTGRMVFEECVRGELRRDGKAVVMLTNQARYLEMADQVVVMDMGAIQHIGTPAELKAAGTLPSPPPSSSSSEEASESSGAQPAVAAEDETKDDSSSASSESLVPEEEQDTSGIPWTLFFRYWALLFPLWSIIPFILIFVLNWGLYWFSYYWSGIIATDKWEGTFSFRQKIYWQLWFAIIQFVLAVSTTFLVCYLDIRSGRIYYGKMLRSLLHAPASFFDTTPNGRILNRLSADMCDLDGKLSYGTYYWFVMWAGMIAQIVLVAVDTTEMWPVGVVCLVIFYIILKIYARCARDFRRVEAMARSPVLSVFSEIGTASSLGAVRTMGLNTMFKEQLYTGTDDWVSSFLIYTLGEKWAAIYLQLLSSILMMAMVLLGWYAMDAVKIPIATTAAITFSYLGSNAVTTHVNLEVMMTNYQRVLRYTESIPQEIESVNSLEADQKHPNIVIARPDQPSSSSSSTQDEEEAGEAGTPTSAPTKEEIDKAKEICTDIPSDWPTTGNLVMEDVCFRYRPHLPFVLNNIALNIQSGQKIGICGRTGAGKSSLIYPLFRFAELNPYLTPGYISSKTRVLAPTVYDPTKADDGNTNRGRLTIDGVDISTVSLPLLRRAVGIVPQEPRLFSGTIRWNLDPTGTCTEEEIMEALDRTQMKSAVLMLQKQLDTLIDPNEQFFSAGQCQLLCLARAALQKTKVVVLDEVTANVDAESEALINSVLRTVFPTHTLLVIAHKLPAILDSDKILVIDAGHVAEFDTPQTLLSNPASLLNALLREP